MPPRVSHPRVTRDTAASATSRGLAYDRRMIDITWLLVIVPAAFAVGGICGMGALALVVESRRRDEAQR